MQLFNQNVPKHPYHSNACYISVLLRLLMFLKYKMKCIIVFFNALPIWFENDNIVYGHTGIVVYTFIGRGPPYREVG